jgi:signal transduction histidine kinase
MMDVETPPKDRVLRWFFIVVALVVPGLGGYEIDYRFSPPPGGPPLDWQTGAVREVPQGSFARQMGLLAGDVVVRIGGVPFAEWNDLTMGNYTVEVERDGRLVTLLAPMVPFGKVSLLSLVSALTVALTLWGLGMVLLLRRFGQAAARLFFLLVQVLAVAMLLLLTNPPTWFRPLWMMQATTACFHLTAPLLLHYALTFPVSLGSPRQRRWGLSLVYGLALLMFLARTLSSEPMWIQMGVLYAVLELGGAVGVLGYVYFRRANPNQRRRLRLIVLCTGLAAGPPTLLFLYSIVTSIPYRLPPWLVGFFIAFAPLSYLYAIARHNLFGIDRLLNRTLVYAILSLGILLLYLGPLVLIYRFLPGDWSVQVITITALTLLVGISFDWMRKRVQRWVDRLFYGGWYDYPGVVEMVSDALARCVEREQLAHVLTRQVPALMQLHEGHLWIREEGAALPERAGLPPMQFPLAFQGQVRGLWGVEPRRDGDDFSEADRRILNTLARQAETAFGSVLLIETLRRQLDALRTSQETLARAQRQLLRSREEERARLARDLHDGPIQVLVGLNIQLGLLLAPAEASPIGEGLGAMRGEVRELLADLRQVCAELRPPMLDTLGLGAALRALAEEWSAQWNVPIRLDLPPDATLRPLPGEVAVNLYRVVQEGLSNVARHAAARLVTVKLVWQTPRLILTVHDDGRGFVVPAHFHGLAAQGHFGLMGISERVNLIGGDWAVESAPGQGTTVRVAWQSQP